MTEHENKKNFEINLDDENTLVLSLTNNALIQCLSLASMVKMIKGVSKTFPEKECTEALKTLVDQFRITGIEDEKSTTK